MYLDIDNIADFVDFHVGRQWDCSMLSEWTREHVSGTATITFWVSHFVDILSYRWMPNGKVNRLELIKLKENGKNGLFSLQFQCESSVNDMKQIGFCALISMRFRIFVYCQPRVLVGILNTQKLNKLLPKFPLKSIEISTNFITLSTIAVYWSIIHCTNLLRFSEIGKFF